jgi:hypothetical protein
VTSLLRYVSADEDSARWSGFPFRPGDIVVSTRSKSGTTWMQMICALLVLGAPDLPAPLAVLSPWVDHTIEPVADVIARLEAQQHRRFLKTHTPLDGLPLDPRATYVVVARHPLDAAVSLYHQGGNVDRERVAELTGVPVRTTDRPPLHDWLVRWTREQTTAREQLDSLVGVLHHVEDAWERREEDNVLLVHYADLIADLDGQMRRVRDRLGISVPDEHWAGLVEAASFERMRSRSAELVPDALGVLVEPVRFFRSGRSGTGREVLTPEELARYEARVASMVSPEVVAWLHR